MMITTTHPSGARRPLYAVVLLAAAIAALALVLLAGPGAPRAQASADQAALMMDDNLLIYGSASDRNVTLFRMKQYGVEGVRVTVLWSVIAQDAMKGSRAKTFRGDDPSTYPHQAWDRYDDLVEAAHAYGMGVLFDVTGPGPAWAHQKTRDKLSAPSWKPKPRAYYSFVRALGKRYSGAYRDENGSSRILPRVTLWSLWNEPNQGASLTPQSEYNPIAKKVIPTAPIVYRRLLYAGIAALRSTGHAKDIILFGETAPLGKDVLGHRKQLRPKLFLRELFCLKPNMQPYTGRQAEARECDLLTRKGAFKLSGYAHHPYTQKNAPTVRDPNPDSVNTANVADLPFLLDRIAARTSLIPPGMSVALTENGWQTRPPDPYYGISLARQAAYMNEADQIAYFNPRISAVTQFLFRDVKPRSEYHGNLKLEWYTWQSGITYADGSPKPSMFAYRLPFNATFAGRNPDGTLRVAIWGQVRIASRNTPQTVHLQYRPQGATVWQSAGQVGFTQAKNFFLDVRSAAGPGVFRAIWVAPDFSHNVVSREVLVAP